MFRRSWPRTWTPDRERRRSAAGPRCVTAQDPDVRRQHRDGPRRRARAQPTCASTRGLAAERRRHRHRRRRPGDDPQQPDRQQRGAPAPGPRPAGRRHPGAASDSPQPVTVPGLDDHAQPREFGGGARSHGIGTANRHARARDDRRQRRRDSAAASIRAPGTATRSRARSSPATTPTNCAGVRPTNDGGNVESATDCGFTNGRQNTTAGLATALDGRRVHAGATRSRSTASRATSPAPVRAPTSATSRARRAARATPAPTRHC